jgi:hypothetical protein
MRKFGLGLIGAAGLATSLFAGQAYAAIAPSGSAALSLTALGTVALNGQTPANSQILAINTTKTEGPLQVGAINGNLTLAAGFASGAAVTPAA